MFQGCPATCDPGTAGSCLQHVDTMSSLEFGIGSFTGFFFLRFAKVERSDTNSSTLSLRVPLCAEQRQKLQGKHVRVWEGAPKTVPWGALRVCAASPLARPGRSRRGPTAIPTPPPVPRPRRPPFTAAPHALTHRCPQPAARGREPPAAGAAAAPRRLQPP